MQYTPTPCRSCGALIIWKQTASGKKMPCEAYPITVVPMHGSKFKALDRFGKLIPCEKVDTPSDVSEIAWEPHWANCPGANNFRRG